MSNFHRKRSLPPLSALPAFEAAARYESFSKAAQALHLTHGAVSRAVASIEDRLGVALFYRRNRRVTLTPAGKLLYQATQTALDDLNETVEAIHRQSTSSPFLVVSCEPTLAMRWLMPRLGEFQAQHPELNVDLRMAGGPIDLLSSGCDLAIRRMDFGAPSDYRIKTLLPERAGPVCTQQYWQNIEQDFSRATLLHSRTRTEAWSSWLASQHKVSLPTQELFYDHFFYALQAAQSGLGMAIGSYPVIADDLNSGLLIAPFGLQATGYEYATMSLETPQLDSRIAAFETWLADVTQDASEW